LSHDLGYEVVAQFWPFLVHLRYSKARGFAAGVGPKFWEDAQKIPRERTWILRWVWYVIPVFGSFSIIQSLGRAGNDLYVRGEQLSKLLQGNCAYLSTCRLSRYSWFPSLFSHLRNWHVSRTVIICKLYLLLISAAMTYSLLTVLIGTDSRHVYRQARPWRSLIDWSLNTNCIRKWNYPKCNEVFTWEIRLLIKDRSQESGRCLKIVNETRWRLWYYRTFDRFHLLRSKKKKTILTEADRWRVG